MNEDFNSAFAAILEEMHIGLAQDLVARIRSKKATSSDLNVARQFLKDNNIEWNPTKKGHPIDGMADLLPEFDDTEDSVTH